MSKWKRRMCNDSSKTRKRSLVEMWKNEKMKKGRREKRRKIGKGEKSGSKGKAKKGRITMFPL